MSGKGKWMTAALILAVVSMGALLLFWRSPGQEEATPLPTLGGFAAGSEGSDLPAESGEASFLDLGDRPERVLRSDSAPGYRSISDLGRAAWSRQGIGAFVSGVVEDLQGEPVAGTRVEVYASRDLDEESLYLDRRVASTTRPDGSFEFLLRSPFHGWLVLNHPDFAPVEDVLHLSSPQALTKRYVLREAGGNLRGQAVEEGSGRPLSGVIVTCTVAPSRGGSLSRRAVSDRRGEFSFAELPVELPIGLLAVSPSHMAAFKSVRFSRAGEDRRVRIQLVSAKTVSVHVVDEAGQGIANAALKSLAMRSARTDVDGIALVVFPRDAAKPVEFSVDASTFVPGKVSIDPRGPDVEVVLRRGPVLRVEVFDPRGSPLSDALVMAWSDRQNSAARGLTDEEGVFVGIPDRTPLRFIRVSHPDYLGQQVDLPPGSGLHPVRVVMERGNSGLRGWVLSASGQPLDAFLLFLRRHGPDTPGGAALSRCFVHTGGEFLLLGIPQGTYDLIIAENTDRLPGRDFAWMRNLELRSGNVLGPLRLRLPPPGSPRPE